MLSGTHWDVHLADKKYKCLYQFFYVKTFVIFLAENAANPYDFGIIHTSHNIAIKRKKRYCDKKIFLRHGFQ